MPAEAHRGAGGVIKRGEEGAMTRLFKPAIIERITEDDLDRIMKWFDRRSSAFALAVVAATILLIIFPAIYLIFLP